MPVQWPSPVAPENAVSGWAIPTVTDQPSVFDADVGRSDELTRLGLGIVQRLPGGGIAQRLVSRRRGVA